MRTRFPRLHPGLCFIVFGLLTAIAHAQNVPAPILDIGYQSNLLQISILNAAGGRVYQIERSFGLGQSAVWTQQFLATPGQTNFILPPQSNTNQFFRAYLLLTPLPQIFSFTASPATVPAGGGTVTLRWSTAGETGLSLKGIGDVTGTTSRVVNVTNTRTFILVATNSVGSVTNQATAVAGVLPSEHNGRFVSFVSPITGQHFLVPGFIRIFVASRDPSVFTNFPRDGNGGNAARTEFLLDNETVAEMDGLDAEYWIFRATLTNLPPGDHVLRVRAFYENPTEILDSDPVTIAVEAPPTYAQTLNLTQDLVLNGSQSLQMVGSPAPGGRVRINGNGFHIRSSGSWAGQFTLRFADIVGLGQLNDGSPAINVSTTAPLAFENCNIDRCGQFSISLEGTATASISSNEFRCNMLAPLGQYPDETYGAQSSYAALRLFGGSTGQKVYRGNNMGAGWLRLTGVNHWVIGGDHDGDGNVFIGPRVGIMLESADHIAVRRNYSHHVYFGGWSQGNNFELGAANDNVVVEHNIVRDSSWAVRDVACEFRYNLILGAGHQWMWITGDNAYVHHNIFAGGDADVTGIWLIYDPQNVRFDNNTVDGYNQNSGPHVLNIGGSATADVQSCAFLNLRSPMTINIEGSSTNLTNVGHNSFYNPQASGPINYSDNRHPATDVGGLNAQVNPNLANPTNAVGIDDVMLWQRTSTTRQVLELYRTRYTPLPGSPLIDSGHGGNGNDIGAVGAGAANPDDQFGILNP